MTTAADRTFDQFDPRSQAFRIDPYPVYESLRRHSPLHYRPTQSDWLVSRYSDVVALIKDRRLGFIPPPQQREERNAQGGPYGVLRARALQTLRLWLNFQEPPDHTRLGQLLQRSFHPDDRSSLRARVQLLADRSIDRAIERGGMDVVRDFAGPLTATVICDILGVPESPRKKLQQPTHEVH